MFSFGSVCSGIEAATCAWHGFAKPLWFSEIDRFTCSVINYHYPDIPNLGDMTMIASKILTRDIPAPDVLIGGTPCQSWSVAGKQRGFDDPRGKLTLTFIEIANAIDTIQREDGKPPVVIVWENVPNVKNGKDNAFGQFISCMAGEHEPLQPPGGKWTSAGYVCSPSRNIAWRVLDAQYFGLPQRRKRLFLVAGSSAFSAEKVLFEFGGNIIPSGERTEEIAPTLTAKSGRRYNDSEVIVTEKSGSRWLTPVECERLMGFPDNYTRIPYRNKPTEDCPDGPRYKAIGNSMAVPVIEWIGKRLQEHIG